MPKVKIVQNPEDEQPVEILADSIIKIAIAFKKMSETRLKRETLVTLLHDQSKVGKPQIRTILNCLDDLENLFLKPKKTK